MMNLDGDVVDIDSLIAKEFNQLSVKERELVYEEIHGVERGIDETKEFLNQRLSEMEHEIQKLHPKTAYDMALQTNPAYIHDPKLRLMFLRCDHLNPRDAARRFVKFTEGKLQLFGPKALARPVVLSDLTSQDMNTLRSGVLQLLPARDVAGRAIITHYQPFSKNFYQSPENLVSWIISSS